jgi:hypothetical protein
MVLQNSHSKTPTGEDETLPKKGSRFAAVMYGVAHWRSI